MEKFIKAENTMQQWQECMESIPEEDFFNLMHLYLGEIKSPYNKQRLISELASFICSSQNIKSMLTLLDKTDIKLLTFISIIPQPTQASISDFFKDTFTYSEIYSALHNLKQRLWIYEKQTDSQKNIFYVTPFLANGLNPYIDIKNILESSENVQFNMEDEFIISPNFLAALISFVNINKLSCKADGQIKKADLARLEECFPKQSNCIQLLVNAFINLSIFKETQKNLEVDMEKLKIFSELPNFQQYAFLCAASCSRYGREGLKKEAQLLIDCLAAIPQSGYTRQNILRLAFLVGSFSESGSFIPKISRFTQILQEAKQTSLSNQENQAVINTELLDRMVDSAITFGILRKIGKNKEGNDIFVRSEFENLYGANFNNIQRFVNIDSTYSVTIMLGLSLKQLIPLTSFMLIKKVGLVSEYEITKKSISYAFNKGWNPEQIISELTKYINYELPQNLLVNITDWYSAYSSAMLYQGYILKVSDKNKNIVDNNPNTKKYIKEKIADGVYLLNIPVNSSIEPFISESGIEFLGNVKKASVQLEFFNFPQLEKAQNYNLLNLYSNGQESPENSIKESNLFLSNLKDVVRNLEIPENQKESLLHRISNRLIISSSQLTTANIRLEILEADGMDFAGKNRLIDAAIQSHDILELTMPNPKNIGTYTTFMGYPLLLSKQVGETVVKFQIEPEQEVINILVSRISHIRRMRY